MYNLNDDTYTCDLCGFTLKWDDSDDDHGSMWECEVCGTNFCSRCLKKAVGEQGFRAVIHKSDNVLCQRCAKSAIENGNIHIEDGLEE